MSEILSASASQQASTSTTQGYKQELKRDQSTLQLVMFGLLCMFPLATTQVWASAHVASMGMAPLVYLIGAIAMFFTAMSYKWMTAEFPVAGSAYSYVGQGINLYIGFIAGWLIVLDYSIIPGMLVNFSTTWLSAIAPNIPAWLIIILFTALLTFVVARGGQVKDWVNNLFFFGQLAVILAFVILAVKFVVIDGQGLGHLSLKPFYNPETFSLSNIASAATLGMLGFIGFDSIATQSEEAKNAVKSVGRAVIASLIIIACLFLVQAYMAALVHPDYTTLDAGMGFFDVIREVGGNTFYYVTIALCVLFVGIANAIPVMTAITRVLYAMGRDNVIPFSGFFKQVNAKTKTPVNATIFIGVITLFIAFFVSLDILSRLVNFGAMSTYFLLNIAVVYYFWVKKKERGIKAVIFFGLFPLLGAAVIAFIFSGFDGLTYGIGLSWLAIGLVILLFKRKEFKNNPPVIEEV